MSVGIRNRVRWNDDEHGRFAARDVYGDDGELLRHPFHCEHATWRNDRVTWIRHREGAVMEPFTGPDAAWQQIIADGITYKELGNQGGT